MNFHPHPSSFFSGRVGGAGMGWERGDIEQCLTLQLNVSAFICESDGLAHRNQRQLQTKPKIEPTDQPIVTHIRKRWLTHWIQRAF